MRKVRVVSCRYTLVGIVVVFVKLAELMTRAVAPFVRWIRSKSDQLLPEQGYDIDGNGKADYRVPQSALAYYTS